MLKARRVLKVSISILVIISVSYLFSNKFKPNFENQYHCNELKKPNEVLIDNVIWQVLELPEGRVNLLNAYLDTRFNRKYVRINSLGPYGLNKTFNQIYCQFWFEDQTKVKIEKVSKFVNLWISYVNIPSELFFYVKVLGLFTNYVRIIFVILNPLFTPLHGIVRFFEGIVRVVTLGT